MEGTVASGAHSETENSIVQRGPPFDGDVRFRDLLFALPAAIYITDLHGRITFFNEVAAQMWGRRPELGKDLWCGSWRIYCVDGSPLPHEESPMAVTLREGARITGREIIVERPDGTRVCVLANPEPLLDVSGRVIGAVNMLVDITERKAAVDEIQELNRSLEAKVTSRTAELETFCRSMAHDLRQHIRGVSLNAHLVSELVETTEPEIKKILDRLNGSAKKLDRMVTDLLRYAKTSRTELKPTQVDLSALANDVSAQLQESYPDAEILIDEGLTAEGDEVSLGVVLLNLIDNAFKYASPDRPLVVEVGRTDGIFHVRDNGIGFDKAYAHQLFEPFQRLQPSSDVPGSGIGLANVKQIVEKHGGEVWADSEPGQGSTFFFKVL